MDINQEESLQKLGLTKGLRVTPDFIDSLIETVEYKVMFGYCTICNVTLYNGFQVQGISNVINPENFNEAKGREIALNKAKSVIGDYAAFLLLERAHQLRKQGARIKVREGYGERAKDLVGVVPSGFFPAAIKSLEVNLSDAPGGELRLAISINGTHLHAQYVTTKPVTISIEPQ